MNKEHYMTRLDLVRKTGAKPYVIDYLKNIGRLPIIKESIGQGHPTLYDPKAMEVIIQHLKKQAI